MYTELVAFIKRGRDGLERPDGNNTRVRIEGNDVVVRLHSTDIVRINKYDTFTLNSGGWYTVTTKKRMNEYLPAGFTVFQKDYEWFVDKRGTIVPFVDGMVLREVA